MNTVTSDVSANGHGELRRDIGIIGLLFASVGSIIGSGWLFGALSAAQEAGPASVVSWLIGAVMVIMIGLCYAELGTMFPVSGGVVRFPHFAFGSFASYTIGWISWLAVASTISIEVLAALQYSTSYLPWLEEIQDGSPVLTRAGFLVAIGLLFLFSLINVVGIRWFARLNNALVWWKLAITILVIVAFMATAFHGANFVDVDAGGFMPFGWSGVFSSVATAGIVFSYLGFRQAIELAGETNNPQRNVPIAVIGSILIAAIIYIGIQTAFIAGLPSEAFNNGWDHIGTSFMIGMDDVSATYGPLVAVATSLGLGWLVILLYIDAFISPADTGLIYTTVTSRISYAMARNGNAPQALAKMNAHGVPWVSVIVTFFAGVIFLLPFPGWQKLVGFVTSASVLSFGSGPLALLAMRRQLPQHTRPFRLPFVKSIVFFGFLSSGLIVYWSGWETVWRLMVAVLLGYVILIIHCLTSRTPTPRLNFRSGLWVPVWLICLMAISWFGSYPDISQGTGNLGILGIGWDALMVALCAAFVMWMALTLRLPVADLNQGDMQDN